MQYSAIFTLNHCEQFEAENYKAAVKHALALLAALQKGEESDRTWEIDMVLAQPNNDERGGSPTA